MDTSSDLHNPAEVVLEPHRRRAEEQQLQLNQTQVKVLWVTLADSKYLPIEFYSRKPYPLPPGWPFKCSPVRNDFSLPPMTSLDNRIADYQDKGELLDSYFASSSASVKPTFYAMSDGEYKAHHDAQKAARVADLEQTKAAYLSALERLEIQIARLTLEGALSDKVKELARTAS